MNKGQTDLKKTYEVVESHKEEFLELFKTDFEDFTNEQRYEYRKLLQNCSKEIPAGYCTSFNLIEQMAYILYYLNGGQ